MPTTTAVHVRFEHHTIVDHKGLRFQVANGHLKEENGVLILADNAVIEHVFPRNAPKHPRSLESPHPEVIIPENILAILAKVA